MYLTLKSLHIVGACLFVGNIIVSAFWKALADRTRSLPVVRFATRLVNVTDAVFTGVGVTLLLVTGHLLAEHYGGVLAQPWIVWSYVLFAISGALWLLILVPLQLKQARILRAAQDAIPREYARLARLWSLTGTIATIVPLPAIYLMVAKGA